MWISRILMESFGDQRDRDIRLGKGLNVIYGPNESGKTTTMEFVRNTLIPTRRQLYPERSKSDSGRIYAVEDGKESIIEFGSRDQPLPDYIKGMDPDFYRNIFAMNQKGLDEIGPLASNEIRSRFLTIPGGESIPAVIESIDEGIKSTLGSIARSPSTVNNIQAEEDEIHRSIDALKAEADQYHILAEKRDQLTSELSSIAESNKDATENNRMYEKVESVRPMYESLRNLKARRSELSSRADVTQQDREEYERLKTDFNNKTYAQSKLEDERDMLFDKVSPSVESKARSNIADIRDILSRRHEYKQQSAQQPASERKKAPVIPLVFVALAILSLVIPGLGMTAKAVIVALCLAVGAASYFLLKPNQDDAPDDTREAYVRDLMALLEEIGVRHTSVDADLERLETIDSTIRALDSMKDRYTAMQLETLSAEKDMISFLSRFGGEEGYQESLNAMAEKEALDQKIDSQKASIRTMGFDPDETLPQLSRIDVDDVRSSEINRELGSLKISMKNALDTEKLDRLMDEEASLASRMNDVLREGAVLMLSSHIIDSACTDIYENVHPDVVKETDRLLHLMTSGKYNLNTDPRSKDISIISEDGPKGPKQWSTGLRAEVLLSLKLAIAKEMGESKVPIILDDVLLPFDRERKRGACRALSELSQDMQILMFTCDDSIPEICRDIEGATVIDIS